jgi:sulfopyruvate decarboxylase alpha subunit
VPTSDSAPPSTAHWAETALAALKVSGVDTIVHVPDKVVNEILIRAEADPSLMVIAMSREEDAVGVVCGLYIGGRKPVLLMQNSGLGNATNALASQAIPYLNPVVMLVSQRGGLGEWNPVQVPMQMASRPLLEALGIEHVSVVRPDDVDAAVRGAVKTAYDGGRSVAVLLDGRLTGGGWR